MIRFFYACGYVTRDAAIAALEDCYADGSISAGDMPAVESYIARNGKRRWGVAVNG